MSLGWGGGSLEHVPPLLFSPRGRGKFRAPGPSFRCLAGISSAPRHNPMTDVTAPLDPWGN